MKHRAKVLHIAALASSIFLVGCYVGYRARLPSFEAKAEQPARQPDQQRTEEFFVGSKSAAVFKPAPKAAKSKRQTMSGSKSMRIVDPEDVEEPASKSPPQPQQEHP